MQNLAADVPTQSGLDQNYPNPFNPETVIRYRVAVSGTRVQLRVFDLLGREVSLLVDKEEQAGDHEVVFGRQTTADRLRSGIYFYRMAATMPGGHRYDETRRMVLLK